MEDDDLMDSQLPNVNGGILMDDDDDEKITSEENLLNEHLACVKEEA